MKRERESKKEREKSCKIVLFDVMFFFIVRYDCFFITIIRLTSFRKWKAHIHTFPTKNEKLLFGQKKNCECFVSFFPSSSSSFYSLSYFPNAFRGIEY